MLNLVKVNFLTLNLFNMLFHRLCFGFKQFTANLVNASIIISFSLNLILKFKTLVPTGENMILHCLRETSTMCERQLDSVRNLFKFKKSYGAIKSFWCLYCCLSIIFINALMLFIEIFLYSRYILINTSS